MDGPACASAEAAGSGDEATPQPRLLERVRAQIRYQRYSYRTKKAYLGWSRQFTRFHGLQHPQAMGGTEVEQFLSALVSDLVRQGKGEGTASRWCQSVLASRCTPSSHAPRPSGLASRCRTRRGRAPERAGTEVADGYPTAILETRSRASDCLLLACRPPASGRSAIYSLTFPISENRLPHIHLWPLTVMRDEAGTAEMFDPPVALFKLRPTRIARLDE